MTGWSALRGVFAVLDSHDVYGVVDFEAKENSPISNSEPLSPWRVIDEFFHIAGALATGSTRERK
jgi:hypothetical protein